MTCWCSERHRQTADGKISLKGVVGQVMSEVPACATLLVRSSLSTPF